MSNSGVYTTVRSSTTGAVMLSEIPNKRSMYTVRLISNESIFIWADRTDMYVKGGPVEFFRSDAIVATIPMSSILYILPPGERS